MRISIPTIKQWVLIAVMVLVTPQLCARAAVASTETNEITELREELANKDKMYRVLVLRLGELERRVNQIEVQATGGDTAGPGGSMTAASVEHQDNMATESLPDLARPESTNQITQSTAANLADNSPTGSIAGEANAASSAVGGSGPQQSTDTQAAAAQLALNDSREQDRLIRSAFERTLIDRGGLLLPAGTYDIEPSLTYVHSSWENIVVDGFTILPVLVIGDIESERVNRDLSLFNLTARIGLPWNTQAEIRVPYGRQNLRSYSADGQELGYSDSGLGDIELAFSTQLYQSSGKLPDLMTSLRWKSDSGDSPFGATEGDVFVGSGYRSTNLLFTAVKVVDPVVYFAGLDYTYNGSTTQSIGNLDPGDSWGFNFGMALALNLNNSLSFAYDQQFTGKSELDGKPIPGSYATTGVFSIGTTFSFTDNLTVDFSLGIGVTEDSPDLLFSTSVPLRGKL
jgi:hypothetical protein